MTAATATATAAPNVPPPPHAANAGTTDNAVASCSTCGHILNTQARFCGSCGQASATHAAPGAGTAPPHSRPVGPGATPPRFTPPNFSAGFGGAGGLGAGLGRGAGAPAASVRLASDPGGAVAHVEEVLRRRGAQTRQAGPGVVQFDLSERHLLNCFINAPLQGSASATGNGAGSQVDLRLSVNWGAATTLLAANGIGLLLCLGMFGSAGLMLGVFGCAIQAYLTGVAFPKSIATKIAAQLQRGTPVAAGPAPNRTSGPTQGARRGAPVPPPPPARPANSNASGNDPGSSQENIFEQIGKLASLRDAGALDEAEFQSKKAELLARL